MKVRDFGHFDGPVVLCGGMFGNIDALSVFEKAAGTLPVIATGDLVGIGPGGDDVVRLFRATDWPTVAGAADSATVEGRPFRRFGGLDLPQAPDLGAEARDWLSGLPDIGTFVQSGRRYAVINGGATERGRLLWPVSSDADFMDEIAAVERAAGPVDGIVSGHSGFAFHRMIGAHQWINAGALGLPSHDGRPETRYAVLTGGDVVIERLTYDAARAATRAREAGAPEALAAMYETGLWPDEDILPRALRRVSESAVGL